MEEVILEAQVRDKKGKSGAKAARREGFIPAVVYGAGKDSQSIKLSRHDFLRFLHQHRLESTVVNLKIKEQKPRTVLVKDVQYHPVKEDIIHIDFQEISLTSKIKVNVEIKAKGEPVGVKQEGGTLNHILWELEVECLPTQIPQEIQVDVSQMKIGEAIHVKDLHLPDGVVPINDPDSLVFSVEAPRKEEEVVAPAAEGEELAEPEVIKEKKEAPEEVEKKKEEKEEKG
jgi:large subunit ribosomal protein L25